MEGRRLLKRQEAVTLLREISSCCQNLSPDYIMLVQAQLTDQFSVGYQLRIRMTLDGATAKQIEAIAAKNSYAVHEEKGEVIIYKPKTITV